MKNSTIYLIQILLAVLISTGCSYVPKLDDVLPDSRTEYRKSRALPDLEVPPDLTLEQGDESMAIPGEEPTSLSAYQRQQAQRRGLSSGLAALESQFPGEEILALRGTASQAWPELRQFFQDKGYTMELDDAELGVLETQWLEDGTGQFRRKFKVFAEADESGENTVLLISSERQEKISLGDSSDWLDQERDAAYERSIVAELKKLYYGDTAPTASKSTAASSGSSWEDPDKEGKPGKQAEIVQVGDSKVYLSLPEEFTKAWRQTEVLLTESGIFIEEKDPNKGLYYILFTSVDEEEEEEGLFSKLKFWKDDEPEGKSYQISLTGVGDKTELVVLNSDGDWETGSDAGRILNLLLSRYNRR